MSDISIHELEAAINFWRARSPSSGDELVLCKEASALSKPYALLIVQRQQTYRRIVWTSRRGKRGSLTCTLIIACRIEGLPERLPALAFHRSPIVQRT